MLFNIDVADGGNIGSLRGLFFDLADPSILDSLHAGEGSNRVFGSDLDNTIVSESGRDQAFYRFASSAVTIDLGAGTATGDDTLLNFEAATGSAFNDLITGSTGSDSLSGHFGDDIIDGGAGLDRVQYYFSGAAVTVDLVAGTATGEGNDTLISIEQVAGSRFDDIITGGAENNDFFGQAGNDIIRGGDGNDLRVRGSRTVSPTRWSISKT